MLQALCNPGPWSPLRPRPCDASFPSHCNLGFLYSNPRMGRLEKVTCSQGGGGCKCPHSPLLQGVSQGAVAWRDTGLWPSPTAPLTQGQDTFSLGLSMFIAKRS